tara:strand:- start:67 stop:744 length:678 start_codon:yes stop_codon:yes gene_type:complete
MPEKSSEKKLSELYNTFQSKDFRDDIAKCIRSKGDKGMDYIPWPNVMDRFFRMCPSATYEFHSYILKLNEKGIQCETHRPYMGDQSTGYFVKTSITCYEVERSMTSPVYGRTFTSVNLKPTARDIHNAQMRCLCKNAAMFGCGIELWTREEEAQMQAEAETPEHTGMDEEKIVPIAKEVFNATDVTAEECDKCGAVMVVKQGRYGSFWACPNYPECKTTKPIVVG